MRIIITFFLIILSHLTLWAQSIPKITGPLGVYHIAAGYSYHDTTGTDSLGMEDEFRFGELAIPNQSIDNGFDFIPQLDSCAQWHANRILGVIQPPHEHGVPNQVADTALLAPYPQLSGPGMIQGGQRFSRLSQLYGGFCGVILDDWNGDTATTHQVRDAVRGKYVDASGTVHSESIETTPANKLYCVIYSADAVPAALPYVDGVIFSVASQNCCYMTMDSDITRLRANFPGKEIITAIFLNNTLIGHWADPASVQYLLAHTLDRYDAGDINGVTIFAGPYFMKDNMPLSVWNGLALPHWLDSLYYPYLGAGHGTAYDCSTRTQLSGTSVRMYCRGRLSGDTMMRSYQLSDAAGQYQCGLWAGNRNTDSTYYWLIAERKGYVTDTIGFWIKRGGNTTIPDIYLCPKINLTEGKLLVYPDPILTKCTVAINDASLNTQPIDVFDINGKRVNRVMSYNGWAQIDMSSSAAGIYFISIGHYVRKVVKE
jgi:hypothetical protein